MQKVGSENSNKTRLYVYNVHLTVRQVLKEKTNFNRVYSLTENS